MNTLNIPNHIAIIPDGNRRWAKKHGLPSLEGHRRGFDVAIKIGRKIRSMGVHTLTMWAFSTENWNRTKEEVNYLMKMYETFIEKNLKEAMKEKIKDFNKYVLNIALDYGGRDEIIRTVKKLSTMNHELSTLSEESFNQFLDTANQPYPDPDLIIRTSGEERTSGLMIWQAAYAEYFFLKKNFPELQDEDIEKAVEEYSRRQRRFGK